ncbi:hypothetical protein [Streptomyces sp. NPDC051183]|uniref:hypothetical protein n=1 Tax=unclassified Streptomyces TaxID=2593676 RepID=UPI003428B88E
MESSSHSSTGATDRPDPPRPRWDPPAPLRILGWSTAVTAVVTALGWAGHHWAATGLPMEPLPGSPWPYLTAWAVIGFAACLLLRAAMAGLDSDGHGGQLVAVPLLAGIRLCLAHRPDPALVYAYGAAALAALAVVALLWRLRLGRG